MIRFRFLFSILLVGCLTSSVYGLSSRELSMEDVLQRAEEMSPELKASKAQEAQARNDIEIGRSYYLPTVDAEAIKSYGFAGSNGALGVGGLMGSPFRAGSAGGLVGEMDIFDLSRDFHFRQTRDLLKAAQAQTRIIRYQVDFNALRIYFDGIRYRGQSDTWASVSDQVNRIVKEVEGFVKTGQQSPVDLMLLQTQADDAAMNHAAFSKQYEIALRRLALIIGIDEKEIACPSPASIQDTSFSKITPGLVSPFVEKSEALLAAAQSNVREKMGTRFPKLTALASFGDMDKTPHLTQKQNYSVGFAVKIPIFDSRISNEVSQSKNIADERKHDLSAANLNLGELNAVYDDTIESSQIKLQYLDHDFGITQDAIQLAKQRYLSYQGPLIDVRESIRSFAAIASKRIDTRVELIFASAAKLLFNGGHIEDDVNK